MSMAMLDPSAPPEPRRWFLSRHALERVTQMGLNRARVVSVLEEPELTWPSHLDRRVASAGDIAVVFDPGNAVVITVLWHVEEDWTRENPPTRAAA